MTPQAQLLVDFDTGGHHHLYITHLVRLALDLDMDPSMLEFALPRVLRDCVAAGLTPPETAFFAPRVRVLEDDPLWIRLSRWITNRRLLQLVYTEVLNLQEKGKRNLTFLHLETVIYQIAFLPLPRFNISGLMFRPTFYYRQKHMLDNGLRDRLFFWLKWITAFALEKRGGIRRIFLLDPLAESYALSRWPSQKFQWIPDPVGPRQGEARPMGSASSIDHRPLVLLVAGALHPRKGLSLTVDALALSSETTRRGLVVSLVGKPMKGFEEYVKNNITRLQALGIRVDEDLRFVSDQEMDQRLAESDVVLTPYRGFKGSSGVLIRAAHFGKPVISTTEGLLGYLVAKHHLGAAVEITGPAALSRCFDLLVSSGRVAGFDPLSARRFADVFSPEEFASFMLNRSETLVGA